VLLSIIVGGSLFGLLGMVIAVPTAAAIQVFVRHGMESYRRSSIYRGDAPPRPVGGAPPTGSEPAG